MREAFRTVKRSRFELPDDARPPAPLQTTTRMKRLVVPAEAVREDLREAVENERVVRAVVLGLWMTAAFLVGLLLVMTR